MQISVLGECSSAVSIPETHTTYNMQRAHTHHTHARAHVQLTPVEETPEEKRSRVHYEKLNRQDLYLHLNTICVLTHIYTHLHAHTHTHTHTHARAPSTLCRRNLSSEDAYGEVQQKEIEEMKRKEIEEMKQKEFEEMQRKKIEEMKVPLTRTSK